MTAIIGGTVFLIYMNVPGVLVSEYGFPRILAFALPLLLAVPFVYRVFFRGEPIRFPALIIAALVMIALHTISALLSEQPGVSLESVFSWLAEGVILAFLLLNALRSRSEVFVVANAIVLAGALMGLIVFLQQILGPQEYGMAGFGQFEASERERVFHRLAGPLGEKNRFAQVMAVLIPIAGGLGVAAPRGRRWLYWIASALIFCGVLMTFSRGALVALALVVPFALVFRLLGLKQLVLAMLLGTIVVGAVPPLAERVTSIGEVALQSVGLAPGGFRNADGAARGRVTQMKAAGLLFLDHPLFGAGPGMAKLHYSDYAALAGGKVRQGTRRAHNLYLQVLAETGAIGLLAFLGMLWVVIYPLDICRRRAEFRDRELWGLACGLELALLIMLATSIFLHAAYIRYFWLLLGLCAAVSILPIRARSQGYMAAVSRHMRRRPLRLEGRA